MQELVWAPTVNLRWKRIKGEHLISLVLQQLYFLYEGDDKEGFMMYGAKIKEEWRDVEISDEEIS